MQQVNLYLPEFRPSEEPLRATQIALVTLTFIVSLVLYTFYGSFQNNQLHAQITARQDRIQTLDAEVAVLRTRMPKDNSSELERENTKLEKEIQKRKLLQELLEDKNLGNTAGFSSQLEGLARQRLSTVSLDTFSLLDGGRSLELSGWLRKADQLPLYLQNLRQESGFEQVRFGVMSIERDPARADAMKFQLSQPGGDL